MTGLCVGGLAIRADFRRKHAQEPHSEGEDGAFGECRKTAWTTCQKLGGRPYAQLKIGATP